MMFSLTSYYLIAVFVTFVPGLLSCKYANLGNDHTMCQYTGKGCAITAGGFSAADKDEAVKIHNELRQKVATGKQNGQPGASNMKAVKWDDELATVAQRWADQCTFGHDKNRNLPTYPYVGQNVYISWSSAAQKLDISKAATSWYDEVTKPGFNKNNIKPFRFDYGSGHYTQVVWAETEKIGCGYSAYISKGMNTILVVCNYGPGGNMEDAAMYEEGKACSKCTSGKCSTKYPGLCE